ncbi:hypothetical protein CDD83_10852 [Cordyceps sp. RAO-2017]|nr:hypothetical protein CDD83_10852 [Cordyceps sp. RAO-2017]
MADTLCDLLGLDPSKDPTIPEYLTRLTELSTDALQSNEPQRLAQISQSLLLSLQALSKRSYKPIVDSTASHASLRQTLPALAGRVSELNSAIPRLEAATCSFSTKFGKASANESITRRKQALRMLQNCRRLVDVMELPLLLTSVVKSSPASYSSSLDLYAHVRRLASLYSSSQLVSSVMREADASIRRMATDMVASLKMPNLKLAAALRTVGWLKRILPDIASGIATENIMPALFLACRVITLVTTLAALEPLRELADEERLRQASSSSSWVGGQQAERYLKRFIEVFREHAFGIVSMSKSVDASFIPSPRVRTEDPFGPPSSALPTFPLHLVSLLLDALQTYLPSVRDQTSRDSIITQVLYCAGSLGRLGADFGVLLAAFGVHEWIDLIKRHRLLAGRLESVIGDYRGNAATSLPLGTAGDCGY